MIIATLATLLPDVLPSRPPCSCVTIFSIAASAPRPHGVVACPIYVILRRCRLSLALSSLLLHLLLHLMLPGRIPMVRLMPISAVAAAASTIPKPSDQRLPPGPRGRPARLVQGTGNPRPSPLALVVV